MKADQLRVITLVWRKHDKKPGLEWWAGSYEGKQKDLREKDKMNLF